MLRRILIVFIVVAVIVGGLGFLKYRQIQGEIAMFSKPQPPATVEAARVETASWQPELRAVGSLQAVQGVMVANQVPGQVEQILFESGDMVEQGQALVQLDTEVDEADLAGLEAARDLAKTQLERNRRLLKDRAVSQGDFDEASASLQQTEAEVASKRAVIEKKTIRAPFAGQLGIRQVNLGQYLAAGSSIAALEALDPVYVDYALPERELAKIATGQPVEIQVAAYPQQRFSGTIQAISPAVDQATRNVRVRGLLKNSEHLLRPGMFAKVTTLLPQQDKVLTLPRSAITFNTYGDSVFLITDGEGEQAGQKVVQRRQVQTGAVRSERVSVVSGLKDGDVVVAAGQVKLRNGVAVSIAAGGDNSEQEPAEPNTDEAAAQTSKQASDKNAEQPAPAANNGAKD
ncbi:MULTISPECIES: efflux RND transporter periplasmic adaptor subunit [Thiorhodovibrio]|uniref:efflux RND transporter periplasmic adaptor subunit n=1 Tax=Thiorhodovibrio TaxID=61593 RepID=UPI001912EC91|nr:MULTISPECIES: efflux RND transporter periplasmic adaptor subunit [Thiorhodovibrio]MBK5970117.1 efflux transporter periplasmic adaptor subunit [Thiorhodovibrio winogradskyi]WPL13500.1 Multidrug resistance protein MdtE precursor [Thiorhodovibrio litoralis]